MRESAALALGLLRRSSPAVRFPSRHLDPVRARLFMVFDQYLGGQRTQVPTRTPAFAMYALGLLRDQPFPPEGMRVRRGKSSGTQTVSLPDGYLDDLDDDTPPCAAAGDAGSGG